MISGTLSEVSNRGLAMAAAAMRWMLCIFSESVISSIAIMLTIKLARQFCSSELAE